MTWAIVTPHSTWTAQVKTAWAALEPQAPTGAELRDLAAAELRDLAAIDQHNFALLIEALVVLVPGQVSQELQDLAGLRPVGEALGLPDLGDTRINAGGDAGDW